jgi:shikimate dehydrogenase
MSLAASTRVFALLGDPVAHSLSPRLQNAAFRAARLDAAYVALRCDAAHLPGLIRGLAHAGGGGNVTLPHKTEACRALDAASSAVQATGACNTFWLEDGRVCGDNTDVEGFTRAAATVVGSLAGARVLVLGAGGGAAAAVHALLQAPADRITLFARSPERAARLAAALDRQGRVIGVAAAAGQWRGEAFDLVVNATPLGLRPDDPLPLDFAEVGRVGAVIDMAYTPDGTAWARAAARRGIPGCDGLVMLVEQGAAAFRRWFAVEPPLSVMREAVRGA